MKKSVPFPDAIVRVVDSVDIHHRHSIESDFQGVIKVNPVKHELGKLLSGVVICLSRLSSIGSIRTRAWLALVLNGKGPLVDFAKSSTFSMLSIADLVISIS